MDPCGAVFGTAELCAYIIDFMHDSVEDLKSCALVSPSFTSFAQSRLFYDINLCGPDSGLSNPNHPEGAYKRLRKCFDASPHLCFFVRRLEVRLDANLIAHLVGMPFQRLNFLSLFQGSMYVQAGAAIAAQYLLSLPSLHTLIIDAHFREGTLALLFASCTPTLRRLDFRYVTTENGASIAASVAKIQIKELRLVNSRSIAKWFAAPQCPVDLGHLQHLNVYGSASPELAVLLEAASTCTTIEALYVHTYDLTHGLHLCSFPALTRLRVVGADPAVLAAALAPESQFESRPPPQLARIQYIKLASSGFQTQNASVPVHLMQVDAALADMHLPALERVILAVMLPPAGAADSGGTGLATIEQTHEGLMRGFPRLRARGVLSVQDYRGGRLH
ncbi:hypothetical protein C8R46DRAFT_1320049 [Mycena filopes]|nr:hypothetical protein C8R46DRAFT_1320049 [Mycena filopes]